MGYRGRNRHDRNCNWICYFSKYIYNIYNVYSFCRFTEKKASTSHHESVSDLFLVYTPLLFVAMYACIYVYEKKTAPVPQVCNIFLLHFYNRIGALRSEGKNLTVYFTTPQNRSLSFDYDIYCFFCKSVFFIIVIEKAL